MLLNKYSLNGATLFGLKADDSKRIVNDAVLVTRETESVKREHIMTVATLNIIWDRLNQWKENDAEDLRSKSAEYIAGVLYEYPLARLISQIRKNEIKGIDIIDILKYKKQNLINTMTGWDDNFVEQIQLIFYEYLSSNKRQIIHHINSVFDKHEISQKTKDKLKQKLINEDLFDVDQLWFNIKNARNLDTNANGSEFAKAIVDIIHALKDMQHKDKDVPESNFYSCYTLIANCFINITGESESTAFRHSMLSWTCYNCQNCNFPQYLGNKAQKNCDLLHCKLCGMEHVSSIIKMIIRAQPESPDTNDISSQDQDLDGINIGIKKVLKHKNIDLTCPNESMNEPCKSLWNLAKELIQYQRWLYTITAKMDRKYRKHRTPMEIYIDTNVLDDDDLYKQSFTKAME